MNAPVDNRFSRRNQAPAFFRRRALWLPQLQKMTLRRQDSVKNIGGVAAEISLIFQ